MAPNAFVIPITVACNLGYRYTRIVTREVPKSPDPRPNIIIPTTKAGKELEKKMNVMENNVFKLLNTVESIQYSLENKNSTISILQNSIEEKKYIIIASTYFLWIFRKTHKKSNLFSF